MRLLARVIGGIGLVPLIAAGLLVAPTVASATSPVVGHVYVNDNTAVTNTIGGFDQHADGTLTPLAGSRSRPAVPGPGRSSAPRDRCRRRATGSSSWRPMPAATRSRCWPSRVTVP